MKDTNLNNNEHHHDRYSYDTIRWIQAIYIIASLLWVILIVVMGLWTEDWIILLILLIPMVVFVINFISLNDFMCSSEDQMFRGNFLSFAFLVAIILINWNTPMGNHDKTEFFKILIVSFILLMISLVDLWVSQENMSVVKHIKTSLTTASLTLLALALYLYYTYHRDQYSYDLE